jgi:hypothetical protein
MTLNKAIKLILAMTSLIFYTHFAFAANQYNYKINVFNHTKLQEPLTFYATIKGKEGYIEAPIPVNAGGWTYGKVTLNISVKDKNNAVIWNSIVDFFGPSSQFTTTAVKLDPVYNVVTDVSPSTQTITFDIKN